MQEPRPEHNFVIETWGSLPLSLLSHDAGATRWSSVPVSAHTFGGREHVPRGTSGCKSLGARTGAASAECRPVSDNSRVQQ